MNEQLIETLERLPSEPAVVIDLYAQLYSGCFWVLVQDQAAQIDELSFLTYPSGDGARELPVFTSPERRLVGGLREQGSDAQLLRIDGPALWRRLLELAASGVCEPAVDPGEAHGIRLTREMILGMVGKYGV